MIAVDSETQEFLAFGAWTTVTAFAGREVEEHAELGWFGVESAAQGALDDDGYLFADRFYATVEDRMRDRTSDETPLSLVCHVENDRGRAFWERQGYILIPDPEHVVEDRHYHRMVKG